MTMCIYDGDTVVTFEHFQSACVFMDEMEDWFGYVFEYCGKDGDHDVYRAR